MPITKQVASDFMPGYVAGRWHTPNGGSNNGTVTSTEFNGRILLVPFYVGKTRIFAEIGCNVGATAAAQIRLGIYSNADGVPGGLILDAGEVSFSTAGAKAIVINQLLPAGWYWLAFVTSATASGTVTGLTFPQWRNGNTTFAGNAFYGLYAEWAYGPLPANLPPVSLQNTRAPLIALKA